MEFVPLKIDFNSSRSPGNTPDDRTTTFTIDSNFQKLSFMFQASRPKKLKSTFLNKQKTEVTPSSSRTARHRKYDSAISSNSLIAASMIPID